MSIIRQMQREKIIKQLEIANAELRLGRSLKASHLYKQVLKKNVLKIFYDADDAYGWEIRPSSAVSFNRAVVLLSDYFSQSTPSGEWFRISSVLINHPAYQSLEINARIQIDLVTIEQNISRQINLTQTIDRISKYLEYPNITNVIEGFIHHVISRLAVLIRDEELAFVHQAQAEKLVSLEQESYYHLLVHQQLGTIYYMLNNDRQHYYEKAIQIYSETEEQARMLDMGHDFTYNGYNLGWIYAELEQFEEAIEQFTRTIMEAESTHNEIMVAKCEYGLGHVYSCLEDYDKSIEYLEDALLYFFDESYLYTAACLNLFAGSLLAIGNIDQAIIRLNYASDNLAKADNPVQLHHVYRHYSIAYFMKRYFLRAFWYFIKTYCLRIRYKMSLLPY